MHPTCLGITLFFAIIIGFCGIVNATADNPYMHTGGQQLLLLAFGILIIGLIVSFAFRNYSYDPGYKARHDDDGYSGDSMSSDGK